MSEVAGVFLMSPPPPGWRIVGGANYRSKTRQPVDPRAALEEWLSLADAIEAAGGTVCVVPPPPEPALLTGLMYTANAGWLYQPRRFRLAHLSVPHRSAEASHLSAVLSAFGWQVEPTRALWEGQADMCWLDPARVVLSYGVRSTFESVAEVQQGLGPGVLSQAAALQNPFFHGDTCMAPLQTPRGACWMVYPGAFASEDAYRECRAFVEPKARVLEIDRADALAYACNGLLVGDTWLGPSGVGGPLQRALEQCGLKVVTLGLPELFGKGGGGPRCLVNELRGLTQMPPGAAYRAQRDQLSVWKGPPAHQ